MSALTRFESEHPTPFTGRNLLLSLVLLACGGVTGSVFAAGGGSSAPPPSAPPEDPQVVAVQHYNAAVQLRERATRLTAELPTIEEEKKRIKTEKKIVNSYRSAERELRSAIRLNPRLFQAHSDLGYSLRKQGKYDEALEAYDRALSLSPGYVEAIEYRAEAYLGLGRVEEAKAAYMTLFERDRGRADELLDAMKVWVEEKKTNPGTVNATAIDDLAAWVATRDSVAQHVAPIGEQSARGWGLE